MLLVMHHLGKNIKSFSNHSQQFNFFSKLAFACPYFYVCCKVLGGKKQVHMHFLTAIVLGGKKENESQMFSI